jgi:FkbM family methyltransferase
MNSTREGHIEYTRDEYNNSDYYNQMLDILNDNKIKSFIDVGACVGEVTKILLEKIPTITRGVMIEPLKDNVAFIKSRINDERIKLLPNAVYYGDSRVKLGRLQNVGGASLFVSENIELCNTITLEELDLPDFIKIDVEGAEINIKENSTRLKEIKFIDIEFHHYCRALDKIVYVKKWLPNHRILLEKENSLFLSL